MTHKLDSDDLFIHCVQRNCAEARLNFFLVEPLWVDSFLESFKKGKVWPRVLLNMHSEHHQPEEVFHRLVRLAAERNTQVIDPPDRALAAFDKGRLHHRLMGAGIHVPYTVLVPQAQASSFQLTDAQRTELGSPFVIKPALGYGRRGVVMDATSERDLARSVAAWPQGDYLLQRRVVPRDLGGRPAYFRVYYVFGSVWESWWNCYTDRYAVVTPSEKQDLSLWPLEDIIRRIARLTGMTFFSSEIAQTDSGQFVAIDYVNDQCHLLSQSAAPHMGVPDEIVAAIAKRLVEAVQEMVRRR
jgi:hypothetical protein